MNILSQMAVSFDFNPWGWIKDIVGFIMNVCNIALQFIGINNLAACIILFTIVIYTILLPLQIRNAKFQKVNSAMNPEIQAISKKYKNKTDNDSRMKQQQELSAVYEKYGTSPTGGCLMSFIQLPILFAVYTVLRYVGEHVASINADTSYSFFRVDIRHTPSEIISIAWDGKFYLALAIGILIPLLSGFFQWLSSKVSMTKTEKVNDSENAVASSMNTMMIVMPIFSIVICYSLQLGLGLYWTTSAVYRTVSQIFINRKMKKILVEELVEKNIEKMNKKRAKKGLPPQQVTKSAQVNTKNIKDISYSNKSVEDYKKNAGGENKTYSSIRDKAFMVSDYNERNNKKK